MTITLHNLRSPHGARRRVKRVGRGNASGHGTTATRGTKGQRARQGGRKGLTQLGVKHFVSHLPKVRGFTTLRIRPQVVTVKDLAKFADGAVVNREALQSQGLVSRALVPVKLIGSGSLGRKLTVQVQAATKGACASVEKAGGTLEIVPLRPKQDQAQ